MKNQSRFWRYLLLMLAIAVVSGVSYVMAAEVWVGPGTNPPDGNRSRPIDTSSEFQTKVGGVRVQDDFLIGAGSGSGVMPAFDLDSFWVTPSDSGSSLGLLGSAQFTGSNNGIVDINGNVSIVFPGANASDSAITAQNSAGVGWSGYFSGAPVGIEKYLIVGTVPAGIPAIGNGYFSGNVYVGGNGGNSQLCLNGSEVANCISSFADIGGADLWQLAADNTSIYYNDGLVGIGTSTPSQKLDIRWDDNLGGGQGVARIRITDLDTGDNPELQLQYGYEDNDHWGLYASESDDSFRIWNPFNGGADRIIVNKYGNLGVGTVSPNAKLDVWGRFRAQQVFTDELKVNDVKYGVSGGSLWVGKDLGNISVCASSDDTACDSVADLTGNTNIVSSAVFNGRLFLGMSDGHLMSCDSKPTCVDLGAQHASSLNNLVIFDNHLWLGFAGTNNVYSCDTSGVCTSHAADTGVNQIDAMTVFDGSLWLTSANNLWSCSSSAGYCQSKSTCGAAPVAFSGLAVFDNSLWLGNDAGEMFKYSIGSTCDSKPGLGGPINKMVVFADKLWVGQGGNFLSSCNSLGVCSNFNVENPSNGANVKSLMVFNGYLWVGMSNGKLTYCTTSGSCNATGYSLTNSVNSLVAYDYPARSCATITRNYDECDMSPLQVEADFVAPASQANTGKCFNGSVMIKKTDCGAKIPEDSLSMGNYCGLKCPAGTTSATGGCQTIGDFRSISGKQLRYFYNASNPLAFTDASYDWGWECQVTGAGSHVLGVWVICQGNFREGTFNPNGTSPCPMGT